MKKMGVGIIGCGLISDFHCQSVRAIDFTELIAVADVQLESARHMGEKYGVDYYEDYTDVLKRNDVDIVNICTPSGMRGKIAADAARHGKHVLSEKPLEVTKERIDAMTEVCRENGVLLGGMFQNRYRVEIRKVQDYIKAGHLGRMIIGSMQLKWYRDPSYYLNGWNRWRGSRAYDGGGALMNQGIHLVDMLQWFMGPVECVSALAGRFVHTEIECEDTLVATIKYRSGAFGVIEAATSVYPGFPARLELTGTNGSIVLEDGLIVSADLKDVKEKLEISVPSEGIGGHATDPMKGKSYKDHMRQIEDFARAVAEGRKEYWLDGREARKAVELIQAAYESAETARTVYIINKHLHAS